MTGEGVGYQMHTCMHALSFSEHRHSLSRSLSLSTQAGRRRKETAKNNYAGDATALVESSESCSNDVVGWCHRSATSKRGAAAGC